MSANVVVLLATYNGMPWLPTQVASILDQKEVNLSLVISDDFSTDGTWMWLQSLAAGDNRVTVLPQTRRFGSAAANFYRLIDDANIKQFEYIAFSDQDDIWELDKLVRHVRIAKEGNFEGVSSDVVAFWQNGKSVKIIKSQPQRELDFLFGSAGPGCTYLMTAWLANELRSVLNHPTAHAKEVALHDWLAYAVCRSAGRRWHIDNVPSVCYRQHETNEFGANHGLKAKLSRIQRFRNHWYRNEVLKILQVCIAVKEVNHQFLELLSLLQSKEIRSRIRLLGYIPQARRRGAERFMLAAMIVAGLF